MGDITIKKCDCCEFETSVRQFNHPKSQRGTVWLCDVCSHTRLSNAVLFPDNCPDPCLYKSIAYIANLLLGEIGRLH